MNDYARHEALDRTRLICDLIIDNLLDHPYVVANSEYRAAVWSAVELLEVVYQQIGKEHLSEPEHTGN